MEDHHRGRPSQAGVLRNGVPYPVFNAARGHAVKANSISRRLLAIAFLASLSTLTFSQSLPNLALTRLNYTVTKRRVNPQGELKQKIDSVDKELAEATRLGRTAEVRRQVAKGLTLLAGKGWAGHPPLAGC